MAYGWTNILARAKSLMLGPSNAILYGIPIDHFRELPPDNALDTCPLVGVGRAFVIEGDGSRRFAEPPNSQTGRILYTSPMVVSIGYVLANGGTETQVLDYQDSLALDQVIDTSREAVEARAAHDRSIVEAALGYWRNFEGLSPARVLQIVPDGGGGLELAKDRAIMRIPFLLMVAESVTPTIL